MDNDSLVIICITYFSNKIYLPRKVQKFMTSSECLQTTLSNNRNNYYVSMNL